MTMAAWIDGLSSTIAAIGIVMGPLSPLIDANSTQRLPSAASSSAFHFRWIIYEANRQLLNNGIIMSLARGVLFSHCKLTHLFIAVRHSNWLICKKKRK